MAKDWNYIVQYDATGKEVARFTTLQEASQAANVHKKRIYQCCQNNRRSDGVTFDMIGHHIWKWSL